MAIEYLDVILAFFPFFMLSNMMNSVIRADGSPRARWRRCWRVRLSISCWTRCLFSASTGGMAGAAWATVLGQLCLVSHLRLVFLPHQDLSAASAQLSS